MITPHQLIVVQHMCDIYTMHQRQHVELGVQLMRGSDDIDSVEQVLTRQYAMDAQQSILKIQALHDSKMVSDYNAQDLAAPYELEMLHILRRAVGQTEAQKAILINQKKRFDQNMKDFNNLCQTLEQHVGTP